MNSYINSIDSFGNPEQDAKVPFRRRRLTKSESNMLKEIFENGNEKPTSQQREALASALKITPRSVQIWFQNRRSKRPRSGASTPSYSSCQSVSIEDSDSSRSAAPSPVNVPFLGQNTWWPELESLHNENPFNAFESDAMYPMGLLNMDQDFLLDNFGLPFDDSTLLESLPFEGPMDPSHLDMFHEPVEQMMAPVEQMMEPIEQMMEPTPVPITQVKQQPKKKVNRIKKAPLKRAQPSVNLSVVDAFFNPYILPSAPLSFVGRRSEIFKNDPKLNINNQAQKIQPTLMTPMGSPFLGYNSSSSALLPSLASFDHGLLLNTGPFMGNALNLQKPEYNGHYVNDFNAFAIPAIPFGLGKPMTSGLSFSYPNML